jgi:uncharacterized delta-60 repeat protein
MKKIITLLLITNVALAQNGSLDATFGIGGKVITAIGLNNSEANATAIQADGKIVVAGFSNNGTRNQFAITRYNNNGSIDTSFGTGGKAITSIGIHDDMANTVAIQTDGEIVVGGQTYNGTNADFALVRYKTNGTIDSTFGTNGIVVTNISTSDDIVFDIVLQTDGKTIITGLSGIANNNDFTLARYNANGTLDTSFGIGGIVTTAVGIDNDFSLSVALQTDGKIVVAGFTYNGLNYDFQLIRYATNGSLDSSFGIGGKVTTSVNNNNDNVIGVVIQPDGKIIIAGTSNNGSNYNFALARYTSTGILDTSFGTGGIVTTSVGVNENYASAIALQTNGKILISGYTYIGNNLDIVLMRYTTTGSLDSSFGTNGIVTTDVAGFADVSTSMAIQNDGKIVIAGHSNDGVNDNFTVLRYKLCTPTSYTTTQSICYGQSVTVGTNIYTNSGIYIDTLIAANTCDSIIITTLNVKQPTASIDIKFACDSLTWINGITYTANDTTAIYQLINIAGCDSTIRLNLTIAKTDTVVNYLLPTPADSLCQIDSLPYPTTGILTGPGVVGNTFYANIAGQGTHTIVYAQYSTYNCRTFIIYKVHDIVVKNCLVGLNNKLNAANITIYPNPSNGTFSITTPQLGTYTIVNELGQIVHTFTTTAAVTTVNISGLPGGMYVVKSNEVGNFQKIVVIK